VKGCRLAADKLAEDRPAGKALVGSKLSRSELFTLMAKVANSTLGCTKRNMASSFQERDYSLFTQHSLDFIFCTI